MCDLLYKLSMLHVSLFNVGIVLANPEQGYTFLWNYEKKV